jgi:hypothetical protein
MSHHLIRCDRCDGATVGWQCLLLDIATEAIQCKALHWLDQEKIARATKDKGQWAASDFQSKQAVLGKLGPLKAADDKIDRVLVCSDPVVSAKVKYLIDAAHDLGMKTMHEFREHAAAPNNGDQSYGPSFPGLFAQAAGLVGAIRLRSVAPSAIGVQRPQTYDLFPP